MIKVAIVGFGNVGFHLANRISEAGHQVTIFSRNPENEDQRLFSEINEGFFDFILLTIPDDHIKSTAAKIESNGPLMLHTSGSRPMSDLENHKNFGVLYPLQTFSKSKAVDFEKLQIFIEGNSQEAQEKIKNFAESLCPAVRALSSQDRARLHLAAVFACNFSNHMYHLAEKQLKDIDMKFQDLQPLVEETLRKALEINPSLAQTGPAVRNDQSTIQKHVDLLDDEKMQKMYKLITESIQESK